MSFTGRKKLEETTILQMDEPIPIESKEEKIIKALTIQNGSFVLEKLQIIVNSLKKTPWPERLRLDIPSSEINSLAFQEFIELLTAGFGTKALELNFEVEDIKRASLLANALEKALKKGRCPHDLKLNFNIPLASNEKTGTTLAEPLKRALQSGQCPEGLEISIRFDNYGEPALGPAQLLAEALKSKHCPNGLKIVLYRNYFGAKGAELLAKALESGHCPENLSLILSNNNIGNQGIASLVRALKNPSCPRNLAISPYENRMDDTSANLIVNMLDQFNYPLGLTIGGHSLLTMNRQDYEDKDDISSSLGNKISSLLHRNKYILICVAAKKTLDPKCVPTEIQHLIFSFFVKEEKECKPFLEKVETVSADFYETPNGHLFFKPQEKEVKTACLPQCVIL